MLANLQRAKKQLAPTFDGLFLKEERNIRELIQNRWLFGKKPDGSIIGVYKSFGYAVSKFQENSRAGFNNVDLTDTGSLGNKIKIALVSQGIEVFSQDEKYNDIAEKYGDSNFNITDSEKEQIINKVMDLTIKKIYRI